MPSPPNAFPSRVLVIGGGVAGGAAAIRLAHLGNTVTLAERALFPREKICGCCLGAAGLRALRAIGLGESVRRLGTPTDRLTGYLQTRRPSLTSASPSERAREIQRASEIQCASKIQLLIATGVAISRSVLDTFLVEQAVRAGVRVWQPFEAQVVTTDNERTLIRYRRAIDSQERDDWQFTDEFDLVVVATGLSGNFSGSQPSGGDTGQSRRWQLPWIQSPHGPLGIAAHLPGEHPLARDWNLERGEIQMVCGDEGYVGLVGLPDGAIDIAAALRLSSKQVDSRDTTERLAGLLLSHPDCSGTRGERISEWLETEARLMTAPPLRRSRWPGRGRVVAIGDCAGYVEPMTGEGMTWGIESGLAVADLWALSGTRDDFANHWQTRLRALQRKRRILCGAVTRAMRSSWLRQAAHVGLTHAPWLAMPITRGLAAGPTFASTVSRLP